MSRCSGCKLPKSEHGFGKPGPYCTGDLDVKSVDDIPAEQLKTPSSNVLVDASCLTSLVDSVKALSEEVKAIRLETRDLRSMVTKEPPHDQGLAANSEKAKIAQVTL